MYCGCGALTVVQVVDVLVLGPLQHAAQCICGAAVGGVAIVVIVIVVHTGPGRCHNKRALAELGSPIGVH